MIKVIDLVYYCHAEYAKPQQVINKHAPASGFARFIKDRIEIQFVKHLNYEGQENAEGVKYMFFKGRNKFWSVPFKTHRYIKKEQPRIIIVEGLIFPLQLISLKLAIGRNCHIIAQHHGEKPYQGIKKVFQRLADKFIDVYLFTSVGNADIWVEGGIISDRSKCSELLEASTSFTRRDRAMSRQLLGIRTKNMFLWVGRLNANKDPSTVLTAFASYAALNPDAALYMIYQEDELLKDVREKIKANGVLKHAVILVGKVEHEKLQEWFSAADVYISGSHKEGSGYALLEAMACGCVPVVTAIPPFKKITDNGKQGVLYKAGDPDALRLALGQLNLMDIESFRNRVEEFFRARLSFKNIADDMYEIIIKCTG